MSVKNSRQAWGSVARFFHWTIALLILGMFIVGYTMEDVAPEDKLFVYTMHKSMGLLVLLLVVCRLVWRWANVRPSLDRFPKWQVFAAESVHWGLYVCMFAMPISGYLMTSFANRPFNLFMDPALPVPMLTQTDMQLNALSRNVHELMAPLFLALLAAHIGAALYHHFIQKDEILARMTPFIRLPRDQS